MPAALTRGSLASANSDIPFAQSLIAKYSASFPTHAPTQSVAKPILQTILIAGTRGGLGANTLAQLLSNDQVYKVYALNRSHRDGKTNQQRQADEFKLQGLDEGLIWRNIAEDTGYGSRLVLLQGNTSDRTLGLGEDLFREIMESVTTIILVGWRVDFRATLAEFEQLIAGVRNVVDIALHSPQAKPPYVLFCSSIGVLNLRKPYPVPEKFFDTPPPNLTSNGYLFSKWVVESILHNAIKNSDMKGRITVARVGQITGSVNGYWKVDEWFPLMVKSSIWLGCFPIDDRPMQLISASLAASGLIAILAYHTPIASVPPSISTPLPPSIPVVHICNPHLVPFTVIVSPIATALSLRLVPRTTWFSLLESSAEQARSDPSLFKKNPALRLLKWMKGVVGAEPIPGTGGLNLTLVGTKFIGEVWKGFEMIGSASQLRVKDDGGDRHGDEALAELAGLGEDVVRGWLRSWVDVGFIDSESGKAVARM